MSARKKDFPDRRGDFSRMVHENPAPSFSFFEGLGRDGFENFSAPQQNRRVARNGPELPAPREVAGHTILSSPRRRLKRFSICNGYVVCRALPISERRAFASHMWPAQEVFLSADDGDGNRTHVVLGEFEAEVLAAELLAAIEAMRKVRREKRRAQKKRREARREQEQQAAERQALERTIKRGHARAKKHRTESKKEPGAASLASGSRTPGRTSSRCLRAV